VKFPTTIGLLSSRSAKKGGAARGKALASAKRRLASGLSQDELLAKIDSLDWDQTVSPNTVVAGGATQAVAISANQSSSQGWRLAAILAGLICATMVVYYVLVPADTQQRQSAAQISRAITASAGQGIEGPATVQRTMTEDLAAVAASEERRAERYEQAVKAVELEAERKAERRQARQAERAKVAAQRERERQQQEEAAKLRAQREADEAARAAAARVREQAAAPKGPTSPQEACAGEGNFIARGLCESRLCSRPEWRTHPQCVKRIDDQMRSLNSGN
jgi:hypothetical protein